MATAIFTGAGLQPPGLFNTHPAAPHDASHGARPGSTHDRMHPHDSVELSGEDDDEEQATAASASQHGEYPQGPNGAVEIAKRYKGQDSGDFKFKNYDHPGGQDNDCAAFVSGCLADAGQLKWQSDDDNVGDLQTNLRNQGWTQTQKPKPGDVAIYNGDQHAELVCGPNGECIGSDNLMVDGSASDQQQVGYDNISDWRPGNTVVYWSPPKEAA